MASQGTDSSRALFAPRPQEEGMMDSNLCLIEVTEGLRRSLRDDISDRSPSPSMRRQPGQVPWHRKTWIALVALLMASLSML